MKICTKCEVPQEESCFSKHKGGKNGLRSTCRDCVALEYESLPAATLKLRNRRAKVWAKKNPEHRARLYQSKNLKKYGLTIESRDALLETQGGRCAICEIDTPGGAGGWHVDHDHVTGKVRGLLCSRCNPMLGYAQDRPETLRAAAEYLERSKRQSLE